MNADGTNTAVSTSAMAINAAPTSSILLIAAARGSSPSAMLRSTFSTTTIASSTTMPTARTSPNSDSVLIVKPNIAMKKKVPTSDTGMAMSGITAARQVCRNITTTSTTRKMASPIVSCTASTDC